ncbi:hypothetical protein [Ferrimonas marina]|uniref:Uncharacterized protein n=1 Tax=Ferrimonas marina TaxID=299255 RepID=A0A1M5P2P1_9GAMM|nr:hypothetical protein [Ferrimonas marina]SHG95453.1 hypothetical protein SAMN02745129_1249 [Ferrimonas marina]
MSLAIIVLSGIFSLLAGSTFALLTMMKERGLFEIIMGTLVTMATVGGSSWLLMWKQMLCLS